MTDFVELQLDAAAIREKLAGQPLEAFYTSPEAVQAYDLIPESAGVPRLYATAKDEDPPVYLKLFTPDSSWTWLILEYDPKEDLAFGYAFSAAFPDGAELGYISIAELREIRGPLGLPVERDIHWTPKPLSAAKDELLRLHGLLDDDDVYEPHSNRKKEDTETMGNTVKLRDLRVHAAQMRTTIDPDQLAGLVQQILTAGLDPNRPIVVAADGAVISGHRRWLAYMVGLAVKEANPEAEEYSLSAILDVIDELAEQAGGNLTNAYPLLQARYGDRDMPVARFDGDERAQILALQSANFGQEKADPKGLAQSFYAAMQAGISVKQIAQNIGQKVSWVESYLALANLPGTLVDLIVAKKLAQGVAVALADLPDPKKTALAKVIAARTQAGSPPSVSAVQAMVRRLKAFNGFTPPMTTDPQERNKARVIAALWQKTLNEHPENAWVVAADGAFNDILDEPWNKAEVAAAFVRAFAPDLVANGGQVNWPQAMAAHIPGAACPNCVVNALPEARLQSELGLPCRRGKTVNGVCLKFATAQESFAYEVPWDWAGLPGVSPDRPYRVVTAAGLQQAWQARQAAEAAEPESESKAVPAPAAKSTGGNSTPPSKPANGAAPETTAPNESPVAKMREAIRDFMARHMELGGANHPLATRCEACRHFRDSSPTKDETVPRCEWAGRLRKVEFSVWQPENGSGQPIPWCRQYAPKESDWSKIIPAHNGAPQMPRSWVEAQIAYLADSVKSYGDNALLLPLTGKPMKSGERYSDWFKNELKKQVGNLTDAQLWTLYIWTLADWQRIQGGKGVLFPADKGAETFAVYRSIRWTGAAK